MANQEVRLRYKRSLLGPFWISLTLLAMILGIGLLYSTIFQQDAVEFLTFFACGILAWNFLSAMLMEGCNAVVYAEQHLRSVPIKTSVLASRSVYSNLIIFFHNALVVAALLAFFRHELKPVALLVLPASALYILLGLLWTIAMAPICTRFRDIGQVVTSVLQVMFFLTPILWRPEFASERPMVTDINPFYHLIEIFRAPLIGVAPTATNWFVSTGIVALFAIAAFFINAYTRKRLYLWL